MFKIHLLAVGGLFLLGCAQQPAGNVAPPAQAPQANSTRGEHAEAAGGHAKSLPAQFQSVGESALAAARAMNSAKYPLPPAEFEPGSASPKDFDAAAITATERGFTIQMPSATPVPTSTVYRGRLFASGGFSSKEFYCFDAKTGKFLWGVELSDDGPSTAVISENDIIFNSESCTIFALDAETGKLRWAHYMGDPMMAAPAVADGRVFTVYPAEAMEPAAVDGGDEAMPPLGSSERPFSLEPTYHLACLDAKSGEVLWRRWLDGDCISSPVAAEGELFVATMSGTLYRLQASDGTIVSAHHARATSAPLVTATNVFFTKRTDELAAKVAVREAIVAMDRTHEAVTLLAIDKPAPYLDRVIQETSSATEKANQFEAANGIGGGFGGGFHSVPDDVQSQVPEDSPPENNAETADPFGGPTASTAESETSPPDALVTQQQSAADNLGLGNVSTLQAYHGSRLIHWQGRNFNCMGDELLCTAADSGEKLWSLPLEGDLHKLGGHLAAPPVLAEGQLFLATVVGDVLRIDPLTGKVRQRHKIGSELRYPPAVSEGRLYVSTQDGKVICVSIGEVTE